jgi:hypothetical protein
VAAGLAVEALPGAGFDRQPRIRAVRAKADAFVSGANRSKNFGRMPDLRVDGTPLLRTYLRFEVNVKSGDVKHVVMLVWSRTRSHDGYQVRLVEAPWLERQITYLNAPSLSSDFVASGPLKAGAWKAVDITSLADETSGGDDSISLALTTTSPKGLDLASRETGLHGPRLVVERRGKNGGPPTTSTGDGYLPN